MGRLHSTFAHPFRTLRRDPRSSLAAILTLTIAVGVVSAVLAVVHGVLLKPLPIRDQSRVVVLRKEQLAGNETLFPFAFADMGQFAEATVSLEGLAGFQYDGAWPVAILDGERRIPAKRALVSGEFFRVLGVRPVVGRVLTAEDDVPGGEHVAVISEGLWRRAFASEVGIMGRAFRTAPSSGAGGGLALRIVGVVPGFELPVHAEMWTPALVALPRAATDRAIAPFNLVGRLRPGATLEQAQAELAAFLAHEPPVPGEPRDVRAAVHRIEWLVVGEVRPALLVLAAGVALLMVLATFNVANLFLLRALERRREFAVRAAIGADHGHIVLQLSSEGLLVGFLGGLGGILAAVWLLRGLVALAPVELPRLEEIRIDLSLVLAAATTAIGSALASSLLPLVVLGPRDLSHTLHAARLGGSTERSTNRVGGVLAVVQVALATVVLLGAGLLTRTLGRLQSLDLGFAAEDLSTIGLELPAQLMGTRTKMQSFHDRVLSQMEGRLGIASATFVLLPPFSGLNGWDASYTAEGQGAAEAAENPALDLQPVLPSYFRTLGIPIRQGRAIGADDREGTNPVIVIGEALARRAWPGQDPIGKRLKLGPADAEVPWRTVVGVVADVRYRELTSPRPVVYAAWAQTYLPSPNLLVVRGPTGFAASLAVVRRAVSEAEPLAVVTDQSSMRQRIDVSLAPPRFNAVVLGALAAVSLVVAAVGIYAIMAALVRRHRREIGIRVAVGAAPAAVRRMVLGRGFALSGLGIVIGLMVGLPAAHLLSAVLYEVRPADPLTIAATLGTLLVVAGLALHFPSRAATRVDPMVVLRAE